MKWDNVLQKIEAERRLNERSSLPFIVDGKCICFYYAIKMLPSKEKAQIHVDRAIAINEANCDVIGLSMDFQINPSMNEFEDEDKYIDYFEKLLNSNVEDINNDMQWVTLERYMPHGLIQVYQEVSNKIVRR